MSLVEHVQSLDSDADIFIYELTNYDMDNPTAKFRFSNFSGVSFGGPTEALAVSHDAIEVSNTGSQQRLQITISDAMGMVTSLVDKYSGIEGAKLTIRRTKRRFLDDGQSPSTAAILQQSTLIISRLVTFIPGDACVFEASNPIDYGNISVPGRVAHNKCSWEYRKSSECGYTGAAKFKLDGTPTLDPKEDVCAKTLGACRLRNNIERFGGFPGLQRR